MSQSPRVMMISTHGYVSSTIEFGKPDTGGQVVYVLELAKSMSRFGYQVDIYTRQFEDQPQIEEVDRDVQIIRIPCGGNEFIGKEWMCEEIPEWSSKAAAYIEKNDLKYDFINSHYWDAGLAGVNLADRLHIPHVHTPHSIGAWKRTNMDGDPAELEKQYNFKKRIKEERIIFQEADGLIATTTQQRDILLGDDYGMAREKITVIPPGYDDTKYFPVSNASRQALKNDHGIEGRVVLALGRMARNKGYDLLIKAMPPVLERHADVKLMLCVGSSEPNDAEITMIEGLKALCAELKIRDRVVFGDYIPDDDMPDYYRMADVFCLCSRYEPFGMTAVEAMACGTPTVVTTEGGLWERLDWGLNAIYANPFDPYEYGSAIHHILAQPKVAGQISRNGSHRARADFTWIGIAQEVIRLAQHSFARERIADREAVEV